MLSVESILHFIGCIITTVSLFSLGVFALYKNYTKPVNVYFALGNFAGAFWAIGDSFIYSVSNHSLSLMLYRLTYIGGIFFTPFLLQTILELSDKKVNEDKFLKVFLPALYIVCGIVAVLSIFTSRMIVDVIKFPYQEVRGSFYFLVIWLCIGVFLMSFYYLIRGYQKAEGIKKVQLKLFLIATIIIFFAASIFFIFATIIKFDIAPVYYLLEVIYSLIVGYTIIQYKFLNINVFLKFVFGFLPCVSLPFLFFLPLNLRITSALCAAIFSFSLGLFAQLKKKNDPVNHYFSLFNFCMGIWNLGELVVLLPLTLLPLFLYRLSYVGASFIVAAYLNFMFGLLGYWERSRSKIKFINILAIVFSIFSLTSLIIKDINYNYPQLVPLKEIPGPLYIPFGIFFIFGLSYSLYPLIPVYRESIGIKRNQIKYVIFAVCFGVVAVSFFFGSMLTEKIPPIHYIIQMGVTASFAIGIIRYKLLDFNIALRNAVVNIGTAFVFSLPLILLFFVIKNPGAYIFLLLMALSLYPLVFKKVAPLLTALLNAKVFSQFSYFKEFPQIERELEETFTTGQVAWRLVKPVAEAMKLIGACCLVYDREEDAFLPKAAVGLNEIMIRGSMEFVTLGLENPLIRYLRTTRLPIIYDMLADVPEEVVIRDVMEDIEAKVCLPLFVGKRMIAVLGLNRKESSNMFNQEDMRSLQSLCHEAEKRLGQVLFTEYRLRFLGGLAHDLRSPFVKPGRLMDILDSIMSGKYGRLDENLQSAVSTAYEDCLDQRRKVELQADVSKQLKRFLDAEQPVAEFNLKPMLDRIIQRNLTEAKIKNIYLQLEYADNIPLILANEEDVERIISNLVENAVKFTQVGGVTIKVNKNADELLIAVKDTGPGITEGDKKKVMKYGGQGETADKSKGLGLGLAIVKELAESNGARFWYETVSGQGSSFFVGIPFIGGSKAG